MFPNNFMSNYLINEIEKEIFSYTELIQNSIVSIFFCILTDTSLVAKNMAKINILAACRSALMNLKKKIPSK